jgi:crossover junction endodeoxyribonuclease RuvC
MKEESIVVLGVDPGFGITGFGVIRRGGNTVSVCDYGFLKLKPTDSLSCRVGVFYSFFQEKIKTHGVTCVSLETSFLGKNAQTFLKLGFLRGVLYLLADQNNLKIIEFSPMEIKQAITGCGGAGKDQVSFMIQRLFPRIIFQGEIKYKDVTDALAIGLCGAWSK